MSFQETMSVLLQYVSDLNADPAVLPIASLCLVTQLFFTWVIKGLPFDGPWKATTSYSAHQVLVVGLMVYQTYWGFVYWNATTHNEQGPPADLVVEETDTQGGKFFSRVVLGSLLAIIPMQFVIFKENTDLLMHCHHAAMFLVASISLGLLSPDKSPIGARYAPFFFGVIELSSIPLVLVDIFHPHKQPEWFAFAERHPSIMKINEINRILFAILYILMRMIYFPKVIFQQVVPDLWNKLQQPENEAYKGPLYTVMISSILFTLLQLYWGSLIFKQIFKMLSGDDREEEKDPGRRRRKKEKDTETKAKVKRV